ncbi:MAG: MerR family transcriptional regulator [Blastocatellia bacterium]
MSKPEYPIRAVARLTGLSLDTLRAWERRYQAVTPARVGHGRLYGEQEIERLKLLRDAVERGHSISRLAPLSDESLRDLLGRSDALAKKKEIEMLAPPVPAPSVAPAPLSLSSGLVDLEPVMEAVNRFSHTDVDRELVRLAMLLPPGELLEKVVGPLMTHIGEEWEDGKLSIAQEHMVSAVLRNLLGTLIRLHSRGDAPIRLLLATPTDELHEFGILSAAMLAAGGGLGVVYLGPNLPAVEILDAARQADARAVLLGMKGATSSPRPLEGFLQIADQLPRTTELWVGGAPGGDTLRRILATRAVFIGDFQVLQQHLTRLGAVY